MGRDDRDSVEPVIEVRNLSKSFDGRRILKRVGLDVYKGETMVVMGGSGCGKSTFLRHLVGAYRPDQGSIRMLGQDLIGLNRAAMNELRKRIGILFQSGALFNSMTVGENVSLIMREHTDLDENLISIMVKIKLELVGLRDAEDMMPEQLSGGMRKRAGLARAIALDPEILFYDEPTTGLDPVLAGAIDQLIMDLSQKLGVTSVVVTHDMNSAFKVADRMAFFYEGELRMIGTPTDFRTTDDPVVQQFITGAADGPIPLRMARVDYAEDLLTEEAASHYNRLSGKFFRGIRAALIDTRRFENPKKPRSRP